jgi:hypothetical protein
MTKSEYIQKLQEIWCKCCAGYHKSNDIAHYINIRYSFGGVEYEVFHNAYIGKDIIQTFNTLDAAQNYLIQELKVQIQDRICFEISRCKDLTDESEMPLSYWEEVEKAFYPIKDMKPDSIQEQDINFEEEYWNLKKENEYLKHQIDLSKKILDDYNIPKTMDEEFFNMEWSLNYRIELLIDKLQKKDK